MSDKSIVLLLCPLSPVLLSSPTPLDIDINLPIFRVFFCESDYHSNPDREAQISLTNNHSNRLEKASHIRSDKRAPM